MMGNGIANIIAALIVAGALVWNGTAGNRNQAATPVSAMSDDEYAEWIARAVGDIKTDVVVNCGCCGEGDGPRRAGDSF